DRAGDLRRQGHGGPHRRREDRTTVLDRRGRQGDRRAAAAEVAAGDVPKCSRQRCGHRSEDGCQDDAMTNSVQSVVVALSISYALTGALLLVMLAYARLRWTVKALAVVVMSAFYIVSFYATRGLLGWASTDSLPASFKLLQARIVDPHSLQGDPGSIYLWVEALDEDSRPSGIPRAYRLPYSEKLAEKIDHAADQIR